MSNIQNDFTKSSQWSLLTEIMSKLLPPVTNMILARLLAPEAFGLVATITMVTSFAEIFANTGFQSYLVQHNFADEHELDRGTDVAFWSNLVVSLILWGAIMVFRNPLSRLVGSPGLSTGIAVAASAIPLTAFSSIQMARYRRAMDFKSLFFVKLVGIFIPVFVTVPLSFLLRSYWAIIIGNLATGLTNAIFLTVRSPWKPRIFFSFTTLKEMFSFSIWVLTDSLLGWANLNIGIFIVGVYLSKYHLGLYKTSMAYVNQVLDIVVNSLSPVLLSTVSRMRNENKDFYPFFYQFEENVSMFIFPMGVGIFVFRELFTKLLLGAQWVEATEFIGLWALMRALLIVFGMFGTTICMSLGNPRSIVVGQIIILSALIPVLLYSAQNGYETLYIARSLVVLWSVAVYLTIGKIAAKISPLKIAIRCIPYFFAAVLMGVAGWRIQQISSSVIWQLFTVCVCVIVYFTILFAIPRTRKTLLTILRGVLRERMPAKLRKK